MQFVSIQGVLFRPVVQRLEDLPALAAGKYLQLLAVLGDRATRDFDVLAAKKFHNFLVRMRALDVLASNDLLDLQFDRLRRQIITLAARNARP
jgi:hypothetical protein